MSAGRIVAAPGEQLLVDRFNAGFEAAQAFHHGQQTAMQGRRYALLARIGEDGHQLADMAASFGDHDAEFRHHAAQVVDQHSALFQQHFSYLVNA